MLSIQKKRRIRSPFYFPSLLPVITASLLALIVLDIAILALQHSLQQPETHMDGPYQFYSSLLWKNSALVYGRDYLIYLGWGLVSTASLLFKLTNQSLGASLFTEYLFHGLLFCLSLLLLIKALFRSDAIALLWLVFFLLLAKYTDQGHLGVLLRPDHSDLGARVSIAAICLFGVYHLSRSSHCLAMPACALLLGLTPLWSNDFGPISAVYGATLLVLLSKGRPWRILWVGLGAALTLALATLWLSQGHVAEMLARTLGVSDYQYWYFGGYKQEDRIYSWADLINRLSDVRYVRNGLLLILISSVTTMFLAFRGDKAWARYLALSFWLMALLSGAIVLEVFGHVYNRYYFALDMASFVSSILLLSKLATLLWSARKPNTKLAPTVPTILLLLANLMLLSELTRSSTAIKTSLPRLACIFSADSCDLEWNDPETTLRLNDIKLALAQNKIPADERLIAEYYTSLSDQLQVEPSLPSALAIHALGDIGRTEWTTAMDDTPFQYALTTDPEWSDYQFWSLHQQWWFYRRIIRKFDPIYGDGQYLIWQRRSGDQRHFSQSEANCKIIRLQADKWLIELPQAADQYLYEVVIHTRGKLTDKAFLRLLWQESSGITEKRDFGSIAQDQEIRFPFNGVKAKLSIEIIGSGQASRFHVDSCDLLSTRFPYKNAIYRQPRP